jgi:spore germination cell wall hydrolase CwlJ-like protein
MVIAISIGNVQAKEGPANPKVDNQLLCLAKNIYYEAGLETREGMVAVAQVTLNRTEDGKFPKTVCGVVNQKTQVTVVKENKPAVKTICQFSWVCKPPSAVRYVSNAWQNSLAVAKEVMYSGLRLENEAMAEALYFHNTHVRPNWGLERVARIGNHIFYSDDKVARK